MFAHRMLSDGVLARREVGCQAAMLSGCQAVGGCVSVLGCVVSQAQAKYSVRIAGNTLVAVVVAAHRMNQRWESLDMHRMRFTSSAASACCCSA